MGVVPALLLRRKVIIKKLQQCGAISEETAKTLEEAGVFNPNAFQKVNEKKDLHGKTYCYPFAD